MTLYSDWLALNSSASLLTMSLLPPVMACHHWISITAYAGVTAASASATTPAKAAPNCRSFIKFLPLHHRFVSRGSRRIDVRTVSSKNGTGAAGSAKNVRGVAGKLEGDV